MHVHFAYPCMQTEPGRESGTRSPARSIGPEPPTIDRSIFTEMPAQHATGTILHACKKVEVISSRRIESF